MPAYTVYLHCLDAPWCFAALLGPLELDATAPEVDEHVLHAAHLHLVALHQLREGQGRLVGVLTPHDTGLF